MGRRSIPTCGLDIAAKLSPGIAITAAAINTIALFVSCFSSVRHEHSKSSMVLSVRTQDKGNERVRIWKQVCLYCGAGICISD
jgi:hypothetical protein